MGNIRHERKVTVKLLTDSSYFRSASELFSSIILVCELEKKNAQAKPEG